MLQKQADKILSLADRARDGLSKINPLHSGGLSHLKNYKLAGGKDLLEPVINPVDPWVLYAEIEALDTRACLVTSGEYRVYCTHADKIPNVLNELGRLREITFREVGEGTGKAIDLDLFDAYYEHLFIWRGDTQELVGAYRLGRADELHDRFGRKGLYTYSLFKYKKRLLQQINPAIELGRSFVRKEYQRDFQPLSLLWKGIGGYIARNPKYKVLFGPVSISGDYDELSRHILVSFLRANHFMQEFARLVKPRQPVARLSRWVAKSSVTAHSLDDVSRVIAQIEHDNKGMPVLLRQYLKLGGMLLGFNIDKQFNNALDGLIMVDLARADSRVLKRYMGAEAAQAFLEYHNSSSRASVLKRAS